MLPAGTIRPPRDGRGGFSLVELAIVVAIIGMLASMIWVYASRGNENVRRTQLAEQMLTIVNGVRTLYTGQSGIGGLIGTLVPKLIAQDAIPSNMVRNGSGCTNTNSLCADTPWGPGASAAGGSFGICAWTAVFPAPAGSNCGSAGGAGPVQFFAVELGSLAFADCLAVVPQNSASGGPTGLLDVIINGKSMVGAGSPLPVSVPLATANCTASSTVDFVYRLQPSSY